MSGSCKADWDRALGTRGCGDIHGHQELTHLTDRLDIGTVMLALEYLKSLLPCKVYTQLGGMSNYSVWIEANGGFDLVSGFQAERERGCAVT